MSHWDNFKEWTKKAALSKPFRWTVSGVTGFTISKSLLDWILPLFPTTPFFIMLDISILLTTTLFAARLTSRGYTAVEEALEKMDLFKLLIDHLKKQFHKQENTIEELNNRVAHLLHDAKSQEENNTQFYLQMAGLIRFCEAVADKFPDEEKETFLRMLQPPSLDEVEGKQKLNKLISSTITLVPDSDSDSTDDILEHKIDIPAESKQTPAINQHSLFSHLYEGARTMYGSFWQNAQRPSAHIELSRQVLDQALLEGLPYNQQEKTLSDGSPSSPGTPPRIF